MIQKDFEKLWHETVETCFNLGNSKGAEYAHGQDRLDNFKRNAKNTAVHPYVVWAIYAGKHWDSITTFVNDKQTGKTRQYSENIQGRIHDMIVYLILLKALIRDVEMEDHRIQHTEEMNKAVSLAQDIGEKAESITYKSPAPEWLEDFNKLVDDFVDRAMGRMSKVSVSPELEKTLDKIGVVAGKPAPYYLITDPVDFIYHIEQSKKNGIVQSVLLEVAVYFIRNNHAVWDGVRLLPTSIEAFENYLHQKGANTAKKQST